MIPFLQTAQKPTVDTRYVFINELFQILFVTNFEDKNSITNVHFTSCVANQLLFFCGHRIDIVDIASVDVI